MLQKALSDMAYNVNLRHSTPRGPIEVAVWMAVKLPRREGLWYCASSNGPTLSRCERTVS